MCLPHKKDNEKHCVEVVHSPPPYKLLRHITLHGVCWALIISGPQIHLEKVSS